MAEEMEWANERYPAGEHRHAVILRIQWSNGYRCPCCISCRWEATRASYGEALDLFTAVLKRDRARLPERDYEEEQEIVGLEAKHSLTGEQLFQLELTWPPTRERRYRETHIQGHFLGHPVEEHHVRELGAE